MTTFAWMLAFAAICFVLAWAYVYFDQRRIRRAWEAEVRRMEREARR